MKGCNLTRVKVKSLKLTLFPIPLVDLRLIDPAQEQSNGVVPTKTPMLKLVVNSKKLKNIP